MAKRSLVNVPAPAPKGSSSASLASRRFGATNAARIRGGIESFKAGLRRFVAMFSGNYGLKLVFQGTQAKTDGNTIVIPELSIFDRPGMTEQELAEALDFLMVTCGFVYHEAAHVMFTGFFKRDEVHAEGGKPIFKIWNAMEDGRIEKKLGDMYPGAHEAIDFMNDWADQRITYMVGNAKANRPCSCGATACTCRLVTTPFSEVLYVINQMLRWPTEYKSKPLYRLMDQRVRDFCETQKATILAALEAKDSRAVMRLAKKLLDAAPKPPEEQPEPPKAPPSPEEKSDEQGQGSSEDGQSDDAGDGEGEAGDGGSGDAGEDREDDLGDDGSSGEDEGDSGEADGEGDGAEDPDHGDDGDGGSEEDASEASDDDGAEGGDDGGDVGDEAGGTGDDLDSDESDAGDMDGGEGGSDADDDLPPEDEDDLTPQSGAGDDSEIDTSGGESEDNEHGQGGEGGATPSGKGPTEKQDDSSGGDDRDSGRDFNPFNEPAVRQPDIADMIQREAESAAEELSRLPQYDRPYLIYTTENDVVGPPPTPSVEQRAAMEKWARELKESMEGTFGVIERNLRNILLAQSKAYHVGGLSSGRLHRGALHKLAQGTSNHVFRQTFESQVLRDVVVGFLIDRSGSMHGKMGMCHQTIMSFGYPLDRLNIPFLIGSYCTTSTGANPFGGPCDNSWYDRWKSSYACKSNCPKCGGKGEIPPVPGHEIYSRFGGIDLMLVKKAEERWSEVVHRLHYVQAHEANIDGESLLWMAKLLMQQPQKRKVLIVLADGAPTGGLGDNIDIMKQHLHTAVAQVREQSPIQLVAIGMMAPEVKKYYGKDSPVVNDMTELPQVVSEQLKPLLLH